MDTVTPEAPLVVQNWIPVPDGQTGAVFTHSPSTQLDTPTYHPALRLRKGETWRDVAKLGKGAFGSVTLQQCQAPATGTARPLRAVKKIVEPRCWHNVSRHWEKVRNEIRANSILSKEKPSMFVQFFGWYEAADATYLCLEYMRLGNLTQCIDRPIPEVDILQVTRQIFRGIRYLHEQGCSHGDISPRNILVASRPPAPDGWRVKIADFGICAFAGSSDYLPWVDVQQAYAIAHSLILFRACLPTVPTTAMLAAGVMGIKKDTALLKSGLSDLCLDFMDFCELKTRHVQLTAADALEHPWMRLRNWGKLHHFAPIAGWNVVPEGSSDVDMDTLSRYVFVKTGKNDSGEWGVVRVDDDSIPRWASLSDGRRGEGVWSAHSAVTGMPPGIWESDASAKFSLSFFQRTGGFENVEHGAGIVRQSTHPAKPAVVISTGRHLLEYGYLTNLRPFGCFNLGCSILGVGHSPDGERLLVALDDHLLISPCDATTGLISKAAGLFRLGDRFSYPCHAAEVSAVAISSCKETVAVGTKSGQVWLGRPTGGSWGKGHWQMIHDVSIDVPGPYISMAFSPDGDKIVAVSGAGDNTVVSVSSAGTLPLGRVTHVLPGALAGALSMDNMDVIQVYVAGWDSEAEGGKPWTRQFALACNVLGCGKGSDCEETRPLNRFW